MFRFRSRQRRTEACDVEAKGKCKERSQFRIVIGRRTLCLLCTDSRTLFKSASGWRPRKQCSTWCGPDQFSVSGVEPQSQTRSRRCRDREEFRIAGDKLYLHRLREVRSRRERDQVMTSKSKTLSPAGTGGLAPNVEMFTIAQEDIVR